MLPNGIHGAFLCFLSKRKPPSRRLCALLLDGKSHVALQQSQANNYHIQWNICNDVQLNQIDLLTVRVECALEATSHFIKTSSHFSVTYLLEKIFGERLNRRFSTEFLRNFIAGQRTTENRYRLCS